MEVKVVSDCELLGNKTTCVAGHQLIIKFLREPQDIDDEGIDLMAVGARAALI